MNQFEVGDWVISEEPERSRWLFYFKKYPVQVSSISPDGRWLGFLCDYPHDFDVSAGKPNFGSFIFKKVANASFKRNLPEWF